MGAPTGTGWTDAEIETLKELVEEGLSTAQIAAAITAKHFGTTSIRRTKNGVIGQMGRLNLKSKVPHGGAGSAPAKPPVERVGPAKRLPLPKPEATVLVAPQTRGVSILGLKLRSCRWPLGEPSATMRYCGEVTVDESRPYCAYHCSMAYGHVPDVRTPGITRPPMRIAARVEDDELPEIEDHDDFQEVMAPEGSEPELEESDA